ncbi:universal stress protein UspA [Halobellus salinus]|uniref:Universal stress protein UspA n=1 Tax=Halobellus salinus TaxID=931585 RepID=A0A830EGF3_9EURY|nr:universal stress protein [Halobellus salinus]GGJ02762.1 universal stress protein UspA [Halobellus salinus]SMP16560.1 Nucleotide-binding universal stress protein, UspA family [Halobellus salinus]
MPTHVLVAVDGSPQSERAVTFVADEWGDASTTLLHVIDPIQAGSDAGVLPSGSEAWYQSAKERADNLLTEGRERLAVTRRDGDSGAARDIDTRTEVGRPAATIVEVGDDIDADHVVVGSHGRQGVSRLVLGSVAEGVVRRSPVPVTVVR